MLLMLKLILMLTWMRMGWRQRRATAALMVTLLPAVKTKKTMRNLAMVIMVVQSHIPHFSGHAFAQSQKRSVVRDLIGVNMLPGLSFGSFGPDLRIWVGLSLGNHLHFRP